MKTFIFIAIVVAFFIGTIAFGATIQPIVKLFATVEKNNVYKIIDADTGATCYVIKNSISCVK